MRVLFTSFAHSSHFYPLVPVAWALRAAGHEVRVASQPDLTETITRAGLTAVPVGQPLSAAAIGSPDWYTNDPWAPELLGQVLDAGSAHVENFDYTGRDTSQWTWESLLRLENIMIPAMYATMNSDSVIDEMVDFARHWRPDLIIWETYTFAGAVAARASGAAHARLIWTPDVALRARQAFLADRESQRPEHREDPTAEWLGWTLGRFGQEFDEEIVTGQWTIDLVPRSVRLDLGLRTVGVQWIPYHGPSVLPGWLRRPADRPRICLTLGSGAMVQYMSEPLSDVLQSVADIDAEIIATVDAGMVGAVPDNMRIEGFVPLHDLLPTCAAVVHHCGIGTTATAMLEGVPQLMLPSIYDSMVKAERIADYGAGLSVPMSKITADELRAKLAQLISGPAYKKAAVALRQEMLDEPTPSELVPVLEKLTAEHRGQSAPMP